MPDSQYEALQKKVLDALIEAEESNPGLITGDTERWYPDTAAKIALDAIWPEIVAMQGAIDLLADSERDIAGALDESRLMNEALYSVLRTERQRWDEIRQWAHRNRPDDAEMQQELEAITARYKERNKDG